MWCGAAGAAALPAASLLAPPQRSLTNDERARQQPLLRNLLPPPAYPQGAPPACERRTQVHNNIQFYTMQYVDAATYQILGNLKIVTTGVLFRIALNRRAADALASPRKPCRGRCCCAAPPVSSSHARPPGA